MKKTLLVLLLAGLLATAAYADDYPEGDEEDAPAEGGDDSEKDVVVLTDANFDDVLKKSKFALIEFYAPWCGHCKALTPHWAKAATILKESNPDVVIAKVDATAATESAGKFSIQGYPTIKWFVDGEFVADYNSGRDTEGIVKWVKKKAGPPATVVSSDGEVADLEKENSFFLLAYFKSAEGEAAKAYLSLAQKTEDVIFAYTTDAAVAAAHGVAEDSVVAIKNFEGDEREAVKLAKELTAENLEEFVKSEKMPLSIEFNQENSGKIFNSGIKKQVLLWAKAADLAPTSDLLKTYREVSKQFKGLLVFVTVNNEAEGSEPVTNYFGLKDAPSPSVVGFFMEKNKKYKLTGEITAESLKAFAAGVVDGTVPADFKSAAEPEEPLDEGVTIVVGKSVDKIVKDPTKDVLLEIYAPWCGHCKKLDPVYKKLAKRFKSVESVVIAKMDGTENEHPDIEVKGFPTILFFPAGEEKAPISFEGGDRGLKALTKFIKEHAKVPYELPKKGAEPTSAAEEPASTEKDEL